MTQGFTRALTIPVPVTQGGTGLIATTTNQLLYSSGTNVIAGLATANNGILVTSAGGVPSIGNTVGAGLTMPSITFNTTTGVVGTTTNNAAAAGSVGENITSSVTSGSAITTNTDTNVTSISLTAGDWLVYGNIAFTATATTAVQAITGWISTTSALLPATYEQIARIEWGSVGITNAATLLMALAVTPRRISLSGTTTIYLSGRATFTISTMAMLGFIGATRMR